MLPVSTKVVPFHKNGSASTVSNYRPFSLLLSISKVLGLVITNQMTSFQNEHDLFIRAQYGFQKKSFNGHLKDRLPLSMVMKSEQWKSYRQNLF